MVFDKNMNPAWCNSPEMTRKWLEHRLEREPHMWDYKVRVGKTNTIVSVRKYLEEGENGNE
jgi:hypothetical protein